MWSRTLCLKHHDANEVGLWWPDIPGRAIPTVSTKRIIVYPGEV